MNCRECQKNLSDYRDDRLDETQRNSVDAHRRECAACDKSYRLVRRSMEIMAAEGPAQPPTGLAERAARAAFTAGQAAPTRSFFDRWIPVAWPSAALAAAAAVVLMLTSPAGAPAASSANVDSISIVMDDAEADDFEGDILGVEEDDEE